MCIQKRKQKVATPKVRKIDVVGWSCWPPGVLPELWMLLLLPDARRWLAIDPRRSSLWRRDRRGIEEGRREEGGKERGRGKRRRGRREGERGVVGAAARR
ncbi:hypothetical protein EJD97_003097 [Solanum chilense]|uniref:Uncharacterized protein n=1 Tax=Solanum chilense TaxID=4083 RepID=A0A6N2AMY3_SOLCI|nr:hypothetical protein EJD97_003097 [Solanum chilense]